MVVKVKRRLNVPFVDDYFDSLLAQRVRGVQLVNNLPLHGRLDEGTLDALGVTDD